MKENTHWDILKFKLFKIQPPNAGAVVVCKYCHTIQFGSGCFCENCGRDIDRQLSGMSDKEVKELYESVGLKLKK